MSNSREIEAEIRKRSDAVTPAVRVEFKKIGRDLVRNAKQRHRFKNETSFLEKSIKSEVSDDGRTLTFYSDMGIAPYGRYVAGGRGTWAPDPFIEQPFVDMAPQMGDRLQKAIAKAVGAT